ncbi:hypothetical protein Riv7116_5714 [Rivularia sp. PCC 7116]|uniref:hypothetical protein n=1 Tax=Rivularia sp. PCC 7116 TaxID=373994 RepID=UPI00029F2032|nr:hypothetical protein [Rivularia sp. PCC 7116]AFY58081.1 hypothetical protein Riv7116_5714 [Rivularia sp. PCC 7116]
MKHPFALEIADLESQLSGQDLLEEVGEEESEKCAGGLSIYTKIDKESGDFCLPYPEPCIYPLPLPKPKPYPCEPVKPKPPVYTTLALGEEGGCYFI